MAAGSNMPIMYRMLQNAGLISGQWIQYATVASALHSSPAAVQAVRDRVDARPLTAQNTAGETGTESRTILRGAGP